MTKYYNGYSDSNIPHLALDDQKDLLLYAMKIYPGDYSNFLNDHKGSKKTSKKRKQEKRKGRKNRKKSRKSKSRRKKSKKSKRKKKARTVHLSNKKASSNSFLPIVVLNSDSKSEKDNHVAKSDSKRKKYWRKRDRQRPPMYERDYYDEYFYDYPPPYSSSWYRHRRTMPRIRSRLGYSMESSNSDYRFTPLEIPKEEKDQKSNKPTNKPILQNFYFRNPDDEDKHKIGSKSTSPNSFGSMLGSRSSQPYASIASMDDTSGSYGYGGGGCGCCCSKKGNLLPMLAALAAAVFFIQQILMMGGRRKRRKKRTAYPDEFLSDLNRSYQGNLDSAIDANKLAKAIAMISEADNHGSLSSTLLNKLCNCDGSVDLMGLGLAALATGVVYIIITRNDGDRRKRRKRRNYVWNYDVDPFIYDVQLEQLGPNSTIAENFFAVNNKTYYEKFRNNSQL